MVPHFGLVICFLEHVVGNLHSLVHPKARRLLGSPKPTPHKGFRPEQPRCDNFAGGACKIERASFLYRLSDGGGQVTNPV
jgi:hypothetical protein